MPEVLLEVRDLAVRYRRQRTTTHALDGVSLDVRSRETVGLVGESGSGKSTLARAILGIVPVHDGTIRFDGQDVTNLPFKRRRELYRHVQIVFQDPYSSLNPSRTVGQTLTEPLRAYGERDDRAIRERVGAMLERVQLPRDAAARYPRQFSGGQRQRIAIARALILSPQLVICDEAVSALDLSVQAQILNLLRDLQATTGVSYLFISHDLDVVRHMCERVVVLLRGRVMESADATAVAGAPAHPYTAALLQAAPVTNPRVQRRRHDADTPQRPARPLADIGAELCPFAPRCPRATDRCLNERPPLRAVDDRLVACHRYPEWRSEAPQAAVSRSHPLEGSTV